MKKRIKALAIVLTLVSVLFFFTDKRGFIEAKMQGYKALRVFAQIENSELTPEFNIYETQHFTIKYTDHDKDIVSDIGRILEKGYRVEGKHYGYYPKGKTLVFLYNDQQSMWDYQKAVKGQAVMGLYSMGIIHVLSPKAYLNQARLSARDFEKDGPVLHEYVHRVVDDISGGNLELWLTEGLALYEEYSVDGVEWAKEYNYERYYTGSELRNNFMELDETQSYRQSFDIVRSLIEQHGRESMNSMLAELKKGSTLNQAFFKTYGIKLDEYINSIVWAKKG